MSGNENTVTTATTAPQATAKAWYGRAVTLGLLFLALGLLYSPLLWPGMAFLLLAPLVVAIGQFDTARQQGDWPLARALAMAFLGIIVAIGVGLLLKK
jgi:hypothetical protein